MRYCSVGKSFLDSTNNDDSTRQNVISDKKLKLYFLQEFKIKCVFLIQGLLSHSVLDQPQENHHRISGVCQNWNHLNCMAVALFLYINNWNTELLKCFSKLIFQQAIYKQFANRLCLLLLVLFLNLDLYYVILHYFLRKKYNSRRHFFSSNKDCKFKPKVR